VRLIRLIPDDTKFGFMRFRRWSFPFSALLSVLTMVLFFGVGLNFGIDFQGGTLVEMQARSGKADVAAVRQTASGLGFGEPEVQEFGNQGGVALRFPLQPGGDAAQQPVVTGVQAAFQTDYEFRRTETVGPRISGELVQAGTIGIILSILAILVYLWFRFELQFAIGAVIATLHDLVLTIGFFVVTQMEFNMNAVAAILTIVGFSLNDTVVVFDRIREILRRYKSMPTEEILDISINSTLSRTVTTSVTTLLSLIALAVWGGTAIEDFAIAMLWGIFVGTYSSIYIAAPILIYLGLRAPAESASPAAAGGGKLPQPAE
jgi:preprotein translocase subunit SecF